MKRGIQLVSGVGFLALFFLAAYPLQQVIPVDLFFRLDPLIAMTAMLASRTLIAGMLWAVLLLVFALIYGRAFCGYICPLGAIIDFFDRLLWKTSSRQKTTPEFDAVGFRNLKIYILIVVLITALFGLMTAQFFDPFAILTRVMTILVFPVVLFLSNIGLDIFRPVAESLDWFTVARFSFVQHTYYMGGITLLFFAGILGLSRIHARFWCRNVCPLGALLGLLAQIGLIKRSVDDACIDCGKCQRACPMAAIPDEPRETLLTECIQCRNCTHACPVDAITFPAHQPFRALRSTRHAAPALSRRGFLASAAAGVTSSFVLAVHPSKAMVNGGLIRPPGAMPEELFLDRCIRCGECMKACTTNTLQPSFLESGPEGLWSPKLVMRYAPCEQRCNVCGQVCPTDAIRALDLEERKHAKIGTAVLYRDRCLVWEQDKLCLICDEQCPYDAIEFRIDNGVRRPFVLEDRCNGCGVCENKCPVQGNAAIEVTPIAAMRMADGSYIDEANRLGYEFSDARDDAEMYFDESPQPVSQGFHTEPPADDQLPPGFAPNDESPQLPPGFMQ